MTLTPRIIPMIPNDQMLLIPSVSTIKWWKSILQPMKVKRIPSPYFKNLNKCTTFDSKKNIDRSPTMAKIFEKNTMYGSFVTTKIAGTLSTAKMRSENSTTISTINNGVTQVFLSFRIKKFCPTYRGKTGKNLLTSLTTG